MIPQETIERIREQIDIVELVGSYLPLKKVGRNFRGLCPFHAERSPSFYVSPERQSYHCFGCGAGGTAISFVMAQEKLDFPEAVKSLGRRVGITVESEPGGGRNQALYDACEKAARFYESELARAPQARAYIERRQLRPETVKRFRLGFAPGSSRLRAEARRLGVSEEALVGAGLLAQRDAGLSDYFFNRVMFPVMSVSGKVVGFSGRVLDDKEPKYLNSPDTPVFHKGELLYGLFQAKGHIRSELPVLVEGNFDLLAMVDAGVESTVAGLGTALTPQQASLLRRYNARAVVCYDGDTAGQKACRRALEVLMSAGVDPQVAVLPAGEDPDSFVRAKGRAGLAGLFGQMRDFVDAVLEGRKLATVPEQRQALGEVVALLGRMQDGATQELYANKIAARFRVDKARLLARRERTSEPRQREVAAGIEERLVAAAVQDGALARVAAELHLSETLADETLRGVARFAEEHGSDAGFGAGMMMDAIGDEEIRRRVAGWTFRLTVPSTEEYRERLRGFRAAWLRRGIDAAHRAGDEERAQALLVEQSALCREIVRERSTRQ